MVGLIGIVACIMLILLNIKAIWFAIIYFCTVTIGGAVNFTFFLRNHEFAPNPKIVTILLLIPIFNILCIWYLARPYFRKYAKEFIEERAKEKHYRKQSKNIKR